MYYCLICKKDIDNKVKNYSLNEFGYYLCREHQDHIREKMNQSATPYAMVLYLELIKRGIRAEAEKWDGHKTIDIAVVEAKINIEVDGSHHNRNPKQALSDLKRTYYSFLKGYFTIRIPNSIIASDLGQTADLVAEMVEESKNQLF
jgi:very-short-patch-repair endonuclease